MPANEDTKPPAAGEGDATVNSSTNDAASPKTKNIERNRPGTRVEDLFSWKESQLEDMESTFSLQQHIQSLIRKNPAEVDAIIELPEGHSENVWQYEHLRQFCQEMNGLVAQLETECNPTTCSEMKADEWLYLCAAHATNKSCSAIDYIIHTLDNATALLNSNKNFPSRVTIQESSVKHFQSTARRLYRVFAHAYFSHRELYDAYEESTHLCERFVKFSKKYKLIPPKLLIIPNQ